MILTLTRRWYTEISTVGELLVDGVWECFTLEDQVRRDDPTTPAEEGRKIPGATAIPAGRYAVVLTPSARVARGGLWSPRADHALPLLVEVPGFEGIRIHAGNSAKDTEGCILLGQRRQVDRVELSRAALTVLLPKLEAGIAGGGCWIHVLDGEPGGRPVSA